MNWLNLELSLLRDDRFMDAEPCDQATWLKMLAYCCQMENGGVLRDAHKWDDRRWLKSVGIMRAEYERPCQLWRNEVGHVHVYGYPVKQEKKCRYLRKIAARGGKARASNIVSMPDPDDLSEASG